MRLARILRVPNALVRQNWKSHEYPFRGGAGAAFPCARCAGVLFASVARERWHVILALCPFLCSILFSFQYIHFNQYFFHIITVFRSLARSHPCCRSATLYSPSYLLSHRVTHHSEKRRFSPRNRNRTAPFPSGSVSRLTTRSGIPIHSRLCFVFVGLC